MPNQRVSLPTPRLRASQREITRARAARTTAMAEALAEEVAVLAEDVDNG